MSDRRSGRTTRQTRHKAGLRNSDGAVRSPGMLISPRTCTLWFSGLRSAKIQRTLRYIV